METLALAAFLNHETADAGKCAQQRTHNSPQTVSGRTAVRPCLFIKYALAIQAGAPLYFFAEGADD